MRAFCARVVQHALFEKTIIGLIVLNGVILGMETSSHWLAEYGTLMVIFKPVYIAGIFC